MRGDTRRLTTDEERERFATAAYRGGLCAACGRVLDDDDVVYIDHVAIDLKPLTAPGAGWIRKTVHRLAPLGEECASPGILAWAEGREPERCAGCDRPMYYAKARAVRQRASCSKRCTHRATNRMRQGEDSR